MPRYRPLIEPAPRVYRVGRRIAFTVSRWYFRTTWEGIEHIPERGPVIVAPNHVSFADPFLVVCVVPRRMYFFALKPFLDMPVFGELLSRAGRLPRGSGRGRCGQRARDPLEAQGRRRARMFPEGTRSYDGHPLEPKPGIGLLVAATDAPVIPVHISGAFHAWSRHHRIPRPRRVHVRFGPPVPLGELRELMRTDRKARRQTQEAMAAKVMTAIAELGASR